MSIIRVFFLKIFVCTILASSLAWADFQHDAKVLAGIEKLQGSRPQSTLEEAFRQPPSLFVDSNRQSMEKFFTAEIPQAQNSKGVIYLFGGPDVLYSQLIFPRYERLLLVGLEPPGELPQIEKIPASQREKIVLDIERAYSNSLRNSYFITSEMAKDLMLYGTTTIIATGLVVQGFEILNIEKVSLSASGQVLVGSPGLASGVRVQFARPDHSRGEVLYFQFNLKDEKMRKNPSLAEFIRRNPFDAAFYKAASYVSHNSDFQMINSLVLEKVRLLIQADDGIPYQLLAQPQVAPSWNLSLYGVYTPPNQMFGVSTQEKLKALFGQQICKAGDGEDRELWKLVWRSDPCQSQEPVRFRSVQWRGVLPFRFGYATVSGPKVVPFPEKRRFGTLQVFTRAN